MKKELGRSKQFKEDPVLLDLIRFDTALNPFRPY